MKAQAVIVSRFTPVRKPYHCVMAVAPQDLVCLRGCNSIGVASLVKTNEARQTGVVGTDLRSNIAKVLHKRGRADLDVRWRHLIELA